MLSSIINDTMATKSVTRPRIWRRGTRLTETLKIFGREGWIQKLESVRMKFEKRTQPGQKPAAAFVA